MRDPSLHPSAIGKVEIQLLDPSTGRPVKSWLFSEQAEITIGRQAGQDIEISDPYVSRCHATLVFQEDHWHLVSQGRNGVIIANRFITEESIESEVSFRLGSEGPTFRFRQAAAEEENMKTITFEPPPSLAFQLDQTKVQNEVKQISDGDYFQSLRKRAKDLRSARRAD